MGSAVRPARKTAAPARASVRAVARPMPLDAPVTMAVLSLSAWLLFIAPPFFDKMTNKVINVKVRGGMGLLHFSMGIERAIQ